MKVRPHSKYFVSKYFKTVLKYFKIFQNISKYFSSKVFQNCFKAVLKYFKCFKTILKLFWTILELFQNCFEIFWNILKLFEFISKHHRNWLYRHCYLPLLIGTIRGNIIACSRFNSQIIQILRICSSSSQNGEFRPDFWWFWNFF